MLFRVLKFRVMSMKKFTTLCLATAVAGAVFGQKPQAPRTAVASRAQATTALKYNVKSDQIQHSANESIVRAQPVNQGPSFAPNGKTAAVNPVGLGQASNVLTVVTTEQNQVWADNALDLVAFIHRNDVGTWGGSSGELRYDLSIDGGTTFTNDIGPVNPAQSRVARYPNITGFNPAGSSNPTETFLAYAAPTLNSAPDFDGHVNGLLAVNSATGTENYSLLSQAAYLPAGLCQGQDGEFWSVDREYASSAFTGNIFINKGVYNGTNDIVWSRFDTITPNNSTSFDGSATVVGPNIAFSPDGNIGWIAWLGDLVGGTDSTLHPIFLKSTDGGDTWSAPMEYDLNSEAWVADSLKSLWVDSLGNVLSTGRATTGFDFDLTVDVNGNPHLAAVIGSGSTIDTPEPGYSIFSGLAKFLGDVTSFDGGTTWTTRYISPVLAFRGELPGTPDPVTMDNFVQVSRSASGSTIFFSWTDSDTAQFTGSMNGIGFGESGNIAPNLRVAAYEPVNNSQSYPKLVTDGDLIWEGRGLFPTMAPIALETTCGWSLPIVMVELLNNDAYATVKFWYFGNDAVICSTDLCDANNLVLSWDVFGFPGATPPCAVGIENDANSAVVLGQSYPNPTAGEAVITFELPVASSINMNLTNMYGQQVAVVAAGEFNAGAHKVSVDTRSLAAGVYFYTLSTEGKSYTKKMIVTK